jgi:ATP-binding cassette subfamily B (MDR/TAP) protein 1
MLMRREITFFDHKRNSPERLTIFLNSAPAEIGKTFGLNFALSLQAFFTVVIAVIIALSAAWKVALVVIACFPLTIILSVVHVKAFGGKYVSSYEITFDELMMNCL